MKRMRRWRSTARVTAAGALLAFVGGASSAVAAPPGTMVSSDPMPPPYATCIAVLHDPCYTAADLERAYGLRRLYAQGLTGKGSTIVIVDPFGSPTIGNDLQVFDAGMGLPNPPHFRVIQPTGPVPPYNPDNVGDVAKAGETTLDVEWSHAIAPGANILLVETATQESGSGGGFPQYMQGIDYVVRHDLGDVVSQSYSLPEANFGSPSVIRRMRYAYRRAASHRVTVLAATNDNGVSGGLPTSSGYYTHRVVQWPATDPLVTAVGGTRLDLDATGRRLAPDAPWNDTWQPVAALGPVPHPWASSGGLSTVFTRPAWQHAVRRVVGGRRGVPDISMSAAMSAGVLVYASYPLPKNAANGWVSGGGTSEATPEFSGIVAIADQYSRQRLNRQRLGLINPGLYKLLGERRSGIVDVTGGNNTVSFTNLSGLINTVVGYNATKGYDLVTGLGTLNASRFVPALVKAVSPPKRRR
jgi:subtilase family serine protease